MRRRERLKKLEKQKERKRRKRNQRLRRAFGGLVVLLVLFAGVRLLLQRDAVPEEEKVHSYEEQVEESGTQPAEEPEEATDDPGEIRWMFNENLARRRVQSEVALLYSLDTDEILYAKNADRISYPASLTKMMTQLVAIENLDEAQLAQQVSISEETYRNMLDEEASLSGFAPGESVTLQDLLYANFLESGGDASETIALHLAGTVDAFVAEMNARAEELGMADTVFLNPTGLHEEGHHTTANDLLKLMQAGLDDERFLTYFTAQSYETEPLDDTENGHTLTARLARKLEDRTVPYKVLGGKTGFTEEAGLCLATVIERSGSRFVLITMGAPYEISRTTDLDDHMWLMRGLSKEE